MSSTNALRIKCQQSVQRELHLKFGIDSPSISNEPLESLVGSFSIATENSDAESLSRSLIKAGMQKPYRDWSCGEAGVLSSILRPFGKQFTSQLCVKLTNYWKTHDVEDVLIFRSPLSFEPILINANDPLYLKLEAIIDSFFQSYEGSLDSTDHPELRLAEELIVGFLVHSINRHYSE